jgi:hypothetical protein
MPNNPFINPNLISKFKHDIRKTWSTIKEILNKTKKKNEFPKHFQSDGGSISDKLMIAEKFNIFFTNIGPKLANSIVTPIGKSFKDYLTNRTNQIFKFQSIDESVTNKIIDSLKPKTSCGRDGISVKLLKLIKLAIAKPVTLIINQCFNTGVFPDLLKIAKILPIFKKDDDAVFDNYRPISLLPAISKIFECVMFSRSLNWDII